ncbi:hypothetical protein BGX23_007768 [Mortierella sp. AD031]|nr:hypothetical protein BGX23_007768 [Mortierella sp. AD031]
MAASTRSRNTIEPEEGQFDYDDCDEPDSDEDAWDWKRRTDAFERLMLEQRKKDLVIAEHKANLEKLVVYQLDEKLYGRAEME